MKKVKVEYVNLDDNRTIEDLEKERNELEKKIFSEKYEKYENGDYKEDKEFKDIIKRINSINKVLEEKKEIKAFGRVLTEEEREKHYEELSEQASKYAEEQARMDELIEKHDQRVAEMQQAYDDFIKSEEELDEIDDKVFPKKQITVKLFPNTHKKLKVMATSKDTTLDKVATAIVEDKIYSMDIVKYVADEFENAQKMFVPGFDDYSTARYGGEQWEDHGKKLYDTNNKLLKKGNPRKRINVKVYDETHMKLRIMAAIQNRSLDNIVSEIIEKELGETIEIDPDKLMDEIIEFKENEK